MSLKNASKRPTRQPTRAASFRRTKAAGRPHTPPDHIDVEQVAAAAARRYPLRQEGHTALRIVNGDADGLPGLWIDDFSGYWLVTTTTELPPSDLTNLACLPEVKAVYWKKLAQGDKTAPVIVAGHAHNPKDALVVVENNLRYRIDFAAGYSQGLFLDQRTNRAEVMHTSHGLRVLNTFAYTCAFGVAAAAGGAAEVVNIDLSKRSLTWGRTNYALNQLHARDEDFIFGDVFDWLHRFAKRGRQFDLVILDPPTFARGQKLRTFRVERDYARLASDALRILSPHGRLIAFANEHRLPLRDFRCQILSALSDTRFRILSCTDHMAEDFRGSHYLKKILVADSRKI